MKSFLTIVLSFIWRNQALSRYVSGSLCHPAVVLRPGFLIHAPSTKFAS